MTPDEAIAIVKSKANGRTRWKGQEPFLDEVLVDEIERLRRRVFMLEHSISSTELDAQLRLEYAEQFVPPNKKLD